MDNDKIYCNKCGATNSKNTTFCTGCGEKLVVSSSKIKCFACLTENPETNMFCSKCGLRLNQLEVEKLPKPKTKQKFKLTVGNGVSLIGALMILVSLFFPVIQVEILGYKETLTFLPKTTLGWEILIFGIILVICSIERSWKPHLVSAAIISFGTIRCFIRYEDLIEDMGEYAGFVDKGAGLYLAIIGCIVSIIGGFLMKNEE